MSRDGVTHNILQSYSLFSLLLVLVVLVELGLRLFLLAKESKSVRATLSALGKCKIFVIEIGLVDFAFFGCYSQILMHATSSALRDY